MTSRRMRWHTRCRRLVLVLLAGTLLGSVFAVPATAKRGDSGRPRIAAGIGIYALRSVEYPSGSGYWFGNYDYSGDWMEDTWRFDHPVSLIFMSWKMRSAENIRNLLRGMGFSAAGSGAGDGGLSVGYSFDPDPASFEVWCGFPGGERMRPDAADEDSFYHVRVYAPNDYWWKASGHPYMWVATCHVDVNESTRWSGAGEYDDLASGLPDPALTDCSYYQFAGNGEFVEKYVADCWEAAYGETAVNRDSAPLYNWEGNVFSVLREAQVIDPSTGLPTWAVGGKWWKCNGKATVLWVK